MKILAFNGSFGILKALEIVIKSAEDNKVDQIICLGDLIGMGEENVECLEIAKEKEIQMISGTFEALVTGQIEKNEADNYLVHQILEVRRQISKEDLFWLSNLKRLTITNNLLFMYGDYIDRYSLFDKEQDYIETDMITRKKHPMLDGIIIGSSNTQSFYNGKKLARIRTMREYTYLETAPAKMIASPGRLVNILRTGIVKSGWVVIDTDEKKVNFLIERNDIDDTLPEIDVYDLESIFSNY